MNKKLIVIFGTVQSLYMYKIVFICTVITIIYYNYYNYYNIINYIIMQLLPHTNYFHIIIQFMFLNWKPPGKKSVG